MVGVGGTTSGGGGYASPNDAVDYYIKSRGSNGLFSQILFSQLSFSASNLRVHDLMSKSEAMVLVYTKKERDGTLSELLCSEVVLNSLNPKWIKKLTLSYQFELVQTLLFHVYDSDTQFQNSREEMLKLDEQRFLQPVHCLRWIFNLNQLEKLSMFGVSMWMRGLDRSTSRRVKCNYSCGRMTNV